MTSEGLKTIINALECYSRLGCNQFNYCLEFNPAFYKLDWVKRQEINDYLHNEIDSRNFGIYSPEVEEFMKAYEIKKEIEMQLVISEQPIMENGGNKDYDGALYKRDYIPTFTDNDGNEINHEIKINIPKKHRAKLEALALKKEWNNIWNYIDKIIDLKNVRGNSTRISDDFTTIIISKPYKISKKHILT